MAVSAESALLCEKNEVLMSSNLPPITSRPRVGTSSTIEGLGCCRLSDNLSDLPVCRASSAFLLGFTLASLPVVGWSSLTKPPLLLFFFEKNFIVELNNVLLTAIAICSFVCGSSLCVR